MPAAHFFLKTVADADPLKAARAAYEADDFAAVESACRERLKTDPNDAHALYLWGCAAARTGRLPVALEVLTRASTLAPDEVAVLIELARVAVQAGRIEDALRVIDRALEVRPALSRLHFLRAHCLRDLGRRPEAIASLQEAVRLDPRDAASWLNLGNLLRLGDEAQQAIHCYDQALATAPEFVEAWINRGVALGDLLMHEAALHSYARARALAPNHSEVDYNEALLRLQTGEYETAWPLYESRWQRPRLAAWRRRYGGGIWQGEPLAQGARLLVHAEQGRGDALQFARYAPLLGRSGLQVILELDPSLLSILSALPGVSAVVAQGDALPAYDLHVSMASLPGFFKTSVHNIPSAQGYLPWPGGARPLNIHPAAAGRAPVVGLVWRGSPRHPNDARRSLTLTQMLTALPDAVSAVCLQSRLTDEERLLLQQRGVRCFDTDARDFSETATRLSQTDLLLTVDTAAAHLAGALGQPVWVLLPFNPDWRWLLSRNDSPWYASARLFRQEIPGDWTNPLRAVHDQLLARASTQPD
jgi:tetratricopeptide (TPR) repeat protein